MEVYILVVESNIVRCIATDECNLHIDKLSMDKYYVEMQGVPGDEYNAKKNTWTSRPENYPQPTKAEINEEKIQAEMLAIAREVAIQTLKDKGELSVNYNQE